MATRFEEFGTTFFLKDGVTPNVGGRLFFREPGTETLRSIFNGSDGLTEIANPTTLDSTGKLTDDVWIDGSYRLTIKGAPDSVTGLAIEIADYDPINSSATTGQWTAWDSTETYVINNIRLATDGRYYKSRVNNNQNNDPANYGSPAQWTHIEFNLATNILSGGGTLLAQVVNIITDGSTYTLPAASSVGAGEDLIVEVPDEFKAFTPTVQRNGTDLIRAASGTDTSIVFGTLTLQSLRFTSDGTSEWSI